MVEIEKLQGKLGEALGLEMAAQKAVEELGSKGLLDENEILTQLLSPLLADLTSYF